jgi:hypothetical protein
MIITVNSDGSNIQVDTLWMDDDAVNSIVNWMCRSQLPTTYDLTLMGREFWLISKSVEKCFIGHINDYKQSDVDCSLNINFYEVPYNPALVSKPESQVSVNSGVESVDKLLKRISS